MNFLVNKVRLKTLLVAVGLIAPAWIFQSVEAAPLSKFFDHPFDALSESQDTAGNRSTSHTVSDGMGHVRTEVVSPSNTLISIFDHESGVLSMIREKDKVILQSKIDPRLMEPDAVIKNNLQPLGNRVINGHPCVGEAFHFANTDFAVWRGQDVDNYTVKSTSRRNGVQTVTQLKSYSHNAPNPAVFNIPTSGYTLQSAVPIPVKTQATAAPAESAPSAPPVSQAPYKAKTAPAEAPTTPASSTSGLPFNPVSTPAPAATPNSGTVPSFLQMP